MRALVIEYGTNRGALAASRALSWSGWTVGVGAANPGGMTAASRSVAYEHTVPRPEVDGDAFVAAVNAAVAERQYEVVFPVDDAQVMMLSDRRSDIGARVPYGPHESVARALDKLELTAAAHRAGLATPKTVTATDGVPTGLCGLLAVKARRYVRLGGHERPGRAETELLEPSEAACRITEIQAAGGEALVQEYVPGRLLSLVVVTDRGSRIAACSQQIADRVWPPRAGVSVRARTVPVDPALLTRVQRLLTDLEWFGLAQLQFLLPENGSPVSSTSTPGSTDRSRSPSGRGRPATRTGGDPIISGWRAICAAPLSSDEAGSSATWWQRCAPPAGRCTACGAATILDRRHVRSPSP